MFFVVFSCVGHQFLLKENGYTFKGDNSFTHYLKGIYSQGKKSDLLRSKFLLELITLYKEIGVQKTNKKLKIVFPLSIKALTALVGRLSLSVSWETCSERVHVSFNP